MLYEPLNDPLELPVQRLTLHCRAERPLRFPEQEGSTPGTTLSGAFGVALWQTACARRRHGYTPCRGEQCAAPFACPVPWLYKPYSSIHQRNMTRPVLLAAPALELERPVVEFQLHITLWGRRAIAHRDMVLEVLHNMALGPSDRRTRFAIHGIEGDEAASIAERTLPFTAVTDTRVLLRFETPFRHGETVTLIETLPDGSRIEHKKRLFLAGGELPLAKLLGNVAYELAAWDMEDRELGDELDQRQRHALARLARQAAEEAAAGITVHSSLIPVGKGRRYSKSGGGFYDLDGFAGEAMLGGDLDPALPWLVALSLGSGGQKRAMGFGRVCLLPVPGSDE